ELVAATRPLVPDLQPLRARRGVRAGARTVDRCAVSAGGCAAHGAGERRARARYARDGTRADHARAGGARPRAGGPARAAGALPPGSLDDSRAGHIAGESGRGRIESDRRAVRLPARAGGAGGADRQESAGLTWTWRDRRAAGAEHGTTWRGS